MLVFAYCMQSWIVYSDETPASFVQLSQKASRGQKLWYKHNCQSCHQLFGFGGFLGPDLTNVSQKFSSESIQAILKTGPGSMPSIKITLSESQELLEFLSEINKLGISDPRAPKVDQVNNSIQFFEIPWFTYDKK